MKAQKEDLLKVISREEQKNKMFFKFKHNILSKYMDLKDSPPFEMYFEKQFLQIINKNANKYSFFKKARKPLNKPLLESIIFKINDSFKSKIEFIDTYNSNNLFSNSNNKNTNKNNSNNNNSDNMINNNKTDNNENSNYIEIPIKNNNDNIDDYENSNNKKADNMNSNNDIKHNKKIFNQNNTNNKNLNNENKDNNEISNNKEPKICNSGDKNLNNNNSKKKKKTKKSYISNSSIGYKSKIIEQKLYKKSQEIQEIISQQEVFLSQIIKENNKKDEKKKITYDKNNLKGTSFETYIIQFIHDLLNCFSSKDEFDYYNNQIIYTEELNKIFRKYQLEEISNIELDFEIVNLKVKDFIDILIYLFPNYINLGNLKLEPFQQKMDFDKLLKMKENYKDSLESIDIFGEIGVNVQTEDEKIEQLIKYMKLFYNINYLVNNNKEESDFILKAFNLSNNNNKVILFISNGDYEQFYERNLNMKTKFIKAQNIFKVNSLLVYFRDKNYSKENDIINYLIFNNNLNNINNTSNIAQNCFYQNKKKFIDNLAKQKQKNIKQNIINNNILEKFHINYVILKEESIILEKNILNF